MTTQTEALKLALEALKELNNTNSYWWQEVDEQTIKKIEPTITAIKEALSQPEHSAPHGEPVIGTKTWFEDGKVVTQHLTAKDIYKDPEQPEHSAPHGEPVGQLLEGVFGRGQVMWFNKPKDESMLYTETPHRTWVGLTNDEFEDIELGCRSTPFGKIEAMRMVEAKLKEKNT